MKKFLKVLGIIILILLLLLALLAWWQWDNIRAIKRAMDYTSDEIEQLIGDNEKRMDDIIDSSPDVHVRRPTEDEREALAADKITVEELAERLAEDGKKKDTAGTEEKDEKLAEYQLDLSELIARVLALREYYVAALENMEQEAREEYSAMPKAERTKQNLADTAQKYISRAGDLERECDGKMDEIVAEMKALIKEYGTGQEILDTVIETYAEEKSLKKAWYLAKIEEKGLI